MIVLFIDDSSKKLAICGFGFFCSIRFSPWDLTTFVIFNLKKKKKLTIMQTHANNSAILAVKEISCGLFLAVHSASCTVYQAFF